jgi:hypothetical protein
MTPATGGPAPLNDDIITRMWDFAEKIHTAKFLPPEVRGDRASVFYLLATAQDMGLAWTHMTRSAFLGSEGGLGMKGDVILALLLQHGFDVQFAFTDNPIGSTCTITRPGGAAVTRSFTMVEAAEIQTRWRPDDSEQGGHWETLAENYFYRNFPREMCQWRSLVKCARVAAPDVIGGIYLPDELLPVPTAGKSNPAPAPPEQFVVGEKPEATAAAAEPAQPEPTPQPLQPETTVTVGESADTATSPVEPHPPALQQAIPPAEQKAEPTAARFDIYEWTIGGLNLVESQDGRTQADLRAQALANATGREHRVMEVLDGVAREVSVAHPPKAAAPAPPAEPTFEDLIARIGGAIGGATKAANKIITRFLSAHMGIPVKALPKDRAKMMPSLLAVAAVLDQRVADLRVDPEGLGNELAGRVRSPLDAEFDRLGWPEHIRMLARRIMADMQQTEEQFLVWINHPMVGDSVSIASLEVEALLIFFPLFALAKGRAWEPLELAVARGWPITKTLTDLAAATAQPIEQWTAEFAAKALDAMAEVVSQAQPASQPPQDDWGDELAFGN